VENLASKLAEKQLAPEWVEEVKKLSMETKSDEEPKP
jgi:hypothetical protein